MNIWRMFDFKVSNANTTQNSNWGALNLIRGWSCKRPPFVCLAGIWAGLTSLLASHPAAAIPSPELVVGSISGLSQLAALASALLGGGALAVGAHVGQRSSRRRNQTLPNTGWKRFAWPVLMVFVLTSVITNIYLVVSQHEAERARLEATLLRATPKATGGKSLDAALKETSFSGQAANAQGISTDQVEKMIRLAEKGDETAPRFLDIRETPETEMGTLPTADRIRFPDIDAEDLSLAKKTVVVFCHNGNRSSETCARLAKHGIDCRFIIGGLEKWLVEGRSLDGRSARSLDKLRALPSFPNQKTLLTTQAVQGLIENEKAAFVDVRYPGEFATGHLPGAVNFPIRPTPTPALEKMLADLPNAPIIAPCYDRRSCFYAEILGLLATRKGHDFRGRYTQPWEFAKPRKLPAHVAELQMRAQQGIFVNFWEMGKYALTQLLLYVSQYTGLVVGLCLLALLSRLLVLPFAVKADRDSQVARKLAPEMKELKARLKSEPRRRARAIQMLYQHHNLTPMRNLLALAFLPVLALCVEAVSAVGRQLPTSFLWLGDLSQPDPYNLLAIVFAVLLGGYLHRVVAQKRWHRVIIWLIATPLLGLMVTWLSSAAGLYLVVSALLLIAQRVIFFVDYSALKHPVKTGRRLWRKVSQRHPGIVSLEDPTALHSAGNKALRLAQLNEQGITVPSGLVLTHKFLGEYAQQDEVWRRRMRRYLWRKVGSKKISVRSSATGEDGAQTSFAGVFETVLDVEVDTFKDALEEVMAAYHAPRVQAYGGDAGALNILLQPMIPAEFAGVMFTEDPQSAGNMMVEMVEGCGEDLVSGRVAPKVFRFGRITGRTLHAEQALINLKALIEIGCKIEAIFDAPQDIEWAYANGCFYILQTRDITVLSHGELSAERNEWRRILNLVVAQGDTVRFEQNNSVRFQHDDSVRFQQNEMSEMLPRPTPLSLSLLEAMWQPGGSMDLALQRLSITYPVEETADPYHVTLFGRLYVDKSQERARTITVGRKAARQLRRNSDKIESNFRDVVMRQDQDDLRYVAALNFNKLSSSELVQLFQDQVESYLYDAHVEVDVVNVAARFYLDDARRQLQTVDGDDAAVMANIPQTLLAKSLHFVPLAPEEERLSVSLEKLGHRARLDYELAVPRYYEETEALHQATEQALDALWRSREEGDFNEAGSPRPESQSWPKSVAKAVSRARKFQTLKEDAKHHVLREYAILRGIVLALDARFALDGLVFFLETDEIFRLNSRTCPQLRGLAQKRREQFQSFKKIDPLPPILRPSDVEQNCIGGDVEASDRLSKRTSALRGIRVSGTENVEGRVVVVPANIAEVGGAIEGFEEGDIIVSSMIHPAWLPEVLKSSGVIAQVGGWLSHMSIVAREHNVAMTVGVSGLNVLSNGDRVRMLSSGDISLLQQAEPPIEQCAIETIEQGPISLPKAEVALAAE
ncbi:MAG: PEP/pyruvate-binding domain-containing protein [Hyphomicrobiaceae bacterium]